MLDRRIYFQQIRGGQQIEKSVESDSSVAPIISRDNGLTTDGRAERRIKTFDAESF
jgi:hypothetical protein